MKTKLFHVVLLLLGALTASADPQITSWFTNDSGKYARIYTSDANKLAGTSVTTWSTGSTTQSSPAYDGVQEVYSSTSWVYIRSTGLGSHVMGPWYLNAAHTQAFPTYPLNKKVNYRIPRTPTIPATKSKNNGGPIGYFVDGIAMFNSWDAFYWNPNTSSESGGGTGGYWNRDAYVNEGVSFDPANAHQPQDGTYHYHANPPALRYLLGDHVDFNSSTKAYTESTSTPTKHSPILGWVADGYPIYGPYGYSSASNANSGIRRMISGYVLRNGQSNTVNLTTTGRTTIPQWAVRLYNVSANQSGPNVSTTYPLGRYMEDNDYLGDLGYTKGVDFDLDEYNGRWCVTPEFPNGTYAYFVSINSGGTPTFPYNIGRGFYGSPTGGSVTTISETVTTNYLGGPSSALVLNTPTVNNANNNVSLVWSSVEGGTYKVESSPDDSTWATKVSSISSQGLSTTTNYTGSSGTGYARVTRTALATFDSAGLAATVTQSATQSYSINDTTPPSITSQPQSKTVAAGISAAFSVVASGAATLSYHWQKDGVELVDGGTISGSATSSLSISPAVVTNAGSFSVIITNAYGAVTSTVVTLTVSAPTVSVSPMTRTIIAGNTATFSAIASGTGTFTYEWQKSGATISGAMSSTLSIKDAIDTDSATYSVIASNSYGSATASSILQVDADQIAPAVSISVPVANSVVTSSALTVNGSAADNSRVSQVLVRVNGGNYQTATFTFSGSTTSASWTSVVTLVPGSNTIEAESIDFSGNVSSLANVTIFYKAFATLKIVTVGQGTVSDPSGTSLVIGSNYTVTALVVSGWLFSNWVNSATATTTSSSSYTFTMQSNLTLTANFVLNQFPQLAGTYYGLFGDTVNGVSHQTGGFIKIVTTSSGKFSGFMIVDGDKLSISGKFDVSGLGTCSVYRRAKSELSVSVQLPFDGSEKITGTISSALDNWQSAITANRSVFAAGNAVNYHGQYTMLVPGFVDSSVGPGGDGYLAIALGSTGGVSASGALGDGVSISAQSATVSRNGDWPLYCTAYVAAFNTGSNIVQTHNGSLQGWVHFTNNNANATFTGQLYWNKTQWTNGYYDNGFSAAVAAVGSVYQKPVSPATRSLFLTNATVTFTGGNLASALNDAVAISDLNTITFTTTNSKSKLAFSKSTGRITGTIYNAMTTTHRSTINGIYLQSTNLNYVGGYFFGSNQTGLFEMQ